MATIYVNKNEETMYYNVALIWLKQGNKLIKCPQIKYQIYMSCAGLSGFCSSHKTILMGFRFIFKVWSFWTWQPITHLLSFYGKSSFEVLQKNPVTLYFDGPL